MNLVRWTEEPEEIRQPTLNLLEPHEPRLSPLQATKGEQQE